MPIPVEHEDVADLQSWGLGLDRVMERCVFCSTGTRYWHKPTNNPVCESCAGLKDISELPPRSLTMADICRLNDLSVQAAEKALANLQEKGLVTGFVPGALHARITLTANAQLLVKQEPVAAAPENRKEK